jgi:hypothetical protein
MDIKRKIGIQAGSVILLSALAAVAIAQDFGMHRSSATRAGVPSLSAATAPATPSVTYNNIGRGFLRWWNPLQDVRTFLDNDDSVAGTPSGISNPVSGVWTTPDNGGLDAMTFAFNFDSKPGITPYDLTRSTPQTLNTTDPTAGATATFRWQFTNLTPGQEYQLFVNIPIGPTVVTQPAAAGDFPQQHYVYRVTGEATPDDEIIDTFATGGGLVRLGDDGAVTSKLYVPTGTTLTITLYNTCPRGGDGGFLDPNATPGAQWLYADSAYISSSNVSEGAVQAQPVVHELSQTAPAGATGLSVNFNTRVNSARNQDFVDGDLGRQVPLASITSFFYDGVAYDGSLGLPANPLEPERLNVAWSWPAKLPVSSLVAETQRYNTDRRDWVAGPVVGNERHTFRSAQDNLAATTTASGIFISDNTIGTFRGGDYFTAPSVVGAPTGAVSYLSNIPNGSYHIQAWMPDADAPGTLSGSVRYNIYRGAVLVDTLTVNQSIGNGWLTLPGQPTAGYLNDLATGRLRVEVTNQGDLVDAGKPVFADSIRFIADADLSVNTSPIAVAATINDGGLVGRDVVVVTMEDGRIYCIDGHGDRFNGTPPQVYWTYPSDNPATDPNNALNEDGRSAEMPTGFNISSGLVANVGGEDLLYIASENGRVYCIEMAGRGDGTTRRRWTWPSEYQPDNPLAARQQPREPIVGSLSFDPVNNHILVPTAEGRLVALDAAGNAVSRTTTEAWQYPALIDPPLGPMTHAPAVAFNQIYFGAPNAVGSVDSEVYSIDPVTGLLNWRTGLTTAGTFAAFGSSGPAPVVGTDIVGGGAFAFIDAVFVADSAGRVVSLNAATGAQQWSTTEMVSGACSSPAFTHLTAFDNLGVLQTNTPAIVVPTFAGGLVGMLIDGSTTLSGDRRVWQYDLQKGPATGIAMGGWRAGDLRSWMYVGDDDGIFYAFNGNNDTNPNPVTPGEEPGNSVITEPDPDSVLDTALDSDKIVLLSPDGYDAMQQQIVDGTLTDADVANYVANETVARRNFEVGESLYIMAWDLPDLGATSTGNYIAEVRVNSPTGSQAIQARQVQVRDVTGPSGTKVMLTAVPLLATGRSAIVPGPSHVTVRLIPTGRRNTSSAETNLGPLASNGIITVANPLSLVFNRVGLNVGTGFNSVGNTPDVYNALNQVNGSPGVDPATTANGPIKETMVGPRPGAYFGPEAPAAGDVVSHAGVGVMDVRVRDRSLSFLIFGPGRGLQNVRLGGQDVVWQVNNIGGGPNVVQNRYKPLSDNGLVYPGFEDAPTLEPNFSLDYPDISRNALQAAKSAFGRVENPFFTGVQLNPPATTNADVATYRTRTGFDNQLTRALSDTAFDVRLNVPRFQPASGPSNAAVNARPGYRSQAFVYVDAGAAGLEPATDANRDFAMAVRVAPDERLTLATPTVDLSSMPGGAGYNGGGLLGGPGGRGPLDPSDPASAFRPWNTGEFDAQFEPYGVLNEGNVNMLNVRTAKSLDDTTNGITRRFRPLELFAPGLHELAWLDGAVHLHTSLDPNYSNTGRAGFDASARMILQKARPGDLVPTRLSVNPIRRVNANVGSTGGTLLNSATFPPGDPQIGVSVPIGTPVGEYIRDIWVFEDTLGTNQSAAVPSLGPAIDLAGFLNNDVLEPYSNPPLSLKFTVRESRLTNRPTSKSSPGVDNLVTGAENFFWSNRQPSSFRNHRGDMYVAWSSNRQTTEADFQNGVLIPNKTAADTANQDNWRIYLSVLRGSVPGAINGPNGPMPLRDLNLWGSPANQWFDNRLAVPGDGVPSTAVFNFDDPNTAGTGEYGTPIAGSERYFSPAFPTNGSFEVFGGTATDNVMMAFLGEVDTAQAGNDRRTLNEIIIARFDTTDPTNLNAPISLSAMPYDVYTKKTAPTIVQDGNTATVIYGAASGGNPQLYYTIFNNGVWTPPRALLGNQNQTGVNAFDRVGNASAQLRAYRNTGNTGRLDVSFTARRRGKANAEAFMATLRTGGNGSPNAGGGGAALPFGPRVDPIAVDAATGTYWAPGAIWRTDGNDLNTASANRLDLMKLQGGAYVSVLDHTTRYFDGDTSLLTYKTTFGGNVTIDPNTGSIKFAGAAIPRGTRLYVRYAPYYLVTSQSGNVNYRSASMVWDDRLIGVYADPTNPTRNLLGDLRYWRTPGNLPISSASDLIRNSRFVLAYTRTSGDGGRPTRPALRTMRFGVQLPTAIALDANGDPVFLQLTGSPGNYQIDAANGRIYFESIGEDQNVTINYRGVDGAGALLGATGNVVYNINRVSETSEEDIPIEQASNESDLFISLDSQNFDNTARRPGLLWLFWTSTRAGGDDVFYQTIAPRFAPRPPAP